MYSISGGSQRITVSGLAFLGIFLSAHVPAYGGTEENEGVYEYRISDHDLNCISFPFESISINTASDAEIEVKNGSIYVMPVSGEPVTIFVTPADVSNWNAMLRLTPADIAPRRIRVPVPEIAGSDHYREHGEPKRNLTPGGVYGKRRGPIAEKHPGTTVNAAIRSDDYQQNLVDGFRSVWTYLGSKEEYTAPSGMERADISSFKDKAHRNFCSLSDEKIADGFYADDFLYLVILAGNDGNHRSGGQVSCGSDVLAYAMLNTLSSFRDTDRIVLLALPGDYHLKD